MKKWVTTLWVLGLVVFTIPAFAQDSNGKFALVIHGGAGTITKEGLGPEAEKEYTEKLEEALRIGDSILASNGTALDAVVAVVSFLEDCPLFNAGKGAVFTDEGKNELDASIMDGKTLKAGSVAGVTTIKNPIKAARAVMEQTSHVMLIGGGAEKFAEEAGLEIVDPSYFFDQKRYDQWKKGHPDAKKGTVGAVALDKYGNLAAATSTGGMTNKKYGRVGDSPIIGAGTYANNQTCAVSSTGWGEYFIRCIAAYDISALMEYKDNDVTTAAETVLKKIENLGGDGGFIALDKEGNIAMPFNTAGMFRAYTDVTGNSKVLLYK